MLHQTRQWTANGDRIIGTADGQPDQTILVLPAPLPTDNHQPTREHTLLITEITAILNGVSRYDTRILLAALTCQLDNGWPAAPSYVARELGLDRRDIHLAYDRLTAAGCGTRPPAGSGARPFTAHLPKPVQ